MITFPNAKINLGLQVINKRSDGFHNIESVFYPIALHDILEIIIAEGNGAFTFKQTGIRLPGGEVNICEKVYNIFAGELAKKNVQMHLHKNIPTGAGLGGGSADAAFAIKTFNTLLNLSLSTNDMENMAATVGSDCAFFIKNTAALASERGEKLTTLKLNLTGLYLYLVKANIHVSTAQAYAGVQPKAAQFSLEQIIEQDLKNWKVQLINDFEDSVFSQHPALKIIKEQLYMLGADYAAMSGSGATIFAISKKPFLEKWETNFPSCFCWSQKL